MFKKYLTAAGKTAGFLLVSWLFILLLRFLPVPWYSNAYVWLGVHGFCAVLGGGLLALLLPCKGRCSGAASYLNSILPNLLFWSIFTLGICAAYYGQAINFMPIAEFMTALAEFISPNNADWTRIALAITLFDLTAHIFCTIMGAFFLLVRFLRMVPPAVSRPAAD